MSEPTPVTKKKGVSKAAIAIALLSIIVIIQSVKIYLDYQQKIEVKEQLTNTEEELATTMQRLNEIKTELDAKIIEIDRLGGDVTELRKAKAEVESQLKRNNARSARDIQELKDRVEGYEELLVLKDNEIARLKSLNTELFSENKTLKTTQNTLSDSINQLTTSKQELATKVAIASQLKAENIVILAVSGKRERESPFRNRQLEKLKVEFNIAENKVAPVEGKKILIKVTDQDGKVIFDVAKGSGTFILDGKEEFYTAAQDILYDNTHQKLSFLYEKGSDYPAGTYTMDVFTEGYKMGTAQFVVR
ncbi:MAG TPA: chromosome segregation protein SMC [Cyclobacteriaceae bacterium]|jgi:cell division protein ZapB|nr:chromosome segregation protein SMC [Cyclobacteriaceae bacterium]